MSRAQPAARHERPCRPRVAAWLALRETNVVTAAESVSAAAGDEGVGEPRAIVVEPRVLRRVIKRHRRLMGVGLHVPHARCYALPRKALLSLTEPHDLGEHDLNGPQHGTSTSVI